MKIYYKKYMKSRGKDIPLDELELVSEKGNQIELKVIDYINDKTI